MAVGTAARRAALTRGEAGTCEGESAHGTGLHGFGLRLIGPRAKPYLRTSVAIPAGESRAGRAVYRRNPPELGFASSDVFFPATSPALAAAGGGR